MAATRIGALMDTTHKRRFRVNSTDVVPVPCAPLGDWLLLLRATTIDFFSLDGMRLPVTTAQMRAISHARYLARSGGVRDDGAQDTTVEGAVAWGARGRALWA